MKLREYIKIALEQGQREFNIGLYPDMTVDDRSPTRIRFKVEKMKTEEELFLKRRGFQRIRWLEALLEKLFGR